MKTQCPHCETVFRVQEAHLSAADGMVRCSQCQQVFDARNHLLDEDNPPPPAEETDFQLDDDPQNSFDLDDELLEPPSANALPAARRNYWGLGAGLLVLALLLQVLWFERSAINRIDGLSVLAAPLCSIGGCDDKPQRDLQKIDINDRDVREHPQRDDALLMNVTLINRAAYSQPFPAVQLQLTDHNVRVIGERRFYPAEYLDTDIPLDSLMPVDTPVQIRLELLAPEQHVSGFRLFLH